MLAAPTPVVPQPVGSQECWRQAHLPWDRWEQCPRLVTPWWEVINSISNNCLWSRGKWKQHLHSVVLAENQKRGWERAVATKRKRRAKQRKTEKARESQRKPEQDGEREKEMEWGGGRGRVLPSGPLYMETSAKGGRDWDTRGFFEQVESSLYAFSLKTWNCSDSSFKNLFTQWGKCSRYCIHRWNSWIVLVI